MTLLYLLLVISTPFLVCFGVVLLILWRVEKFMHRVLAYIKADTVYGAENALTPPKQTEAIPEDPLKDLRRLQDQAYSPK